MAYDNELDQLRNWLENNIGEVKSLSRQTRWRPSWFADVQRGEDLLNLYIRGDRVDMPLIFPLKHEMLLQSLMHERGIPVAEVYGWIDEPMSYVMGCVDGAQDFTESTVEERDTVVDEYLQILARLHKLNVDEFSAAGIERATSPDQSGMLGISRYERVYRQVKNAPDPFMEFCLGWLHRNPPNSKNREAVVVWDSGQFLHKNGKISAVIDVEIGHIGDPMMDLAGWRMRDTVMGYGDFNALYSRYSDLTGEPVDMEAIKRYHFAFALTPHMPIVHSLRNPPQQSDLMTNLQWCGESDLFALEAMAEILQVEVPEVDIPAPSQSRATPAFNLLIEGLKSAHTDDPNLRFELRKMFRLARHAQRFDEIGAAISSADLDDIHELLGYRPENWFDGEADLERFVLSDAKSGQHDEKLLKLFYKRIRRGQILLGPENSAMARHLSIQPFNAK